MLTTELGLKADSASMKEIGQIVSRIKGDDEKDAKDVDDSDENEEDDKNQEDDTEDTTDTDDEKDKFMKEQLAKFDKTTGLSEDEVLHVLNYVWKDHVNNKQEAEGNKQDAAQNDKKYKKKRKREENEELCHPKNWSLKLLKNVVEECGFKKSGSKNDLVERIIQASKNW